MMKYYPGKDNIVQESLSNEVYVLKHLLLLLKEDNVTLKEEHII